MNIVKSAKKPNYGGAFGIEEDQLFIKEELVEFGEDVADYVNSHFPYGFNPQIECTGAYADGKVMDYDFSNDDIGEFNIKVPVDLRKTRGFNWNKIKDVYMENTAKKVLDYFVKEYDSWGEDFDSKKSVNSAKDVEQMYSNLYDELYKAAKKFMMSPKVGFPENEVDEYMVIDINDVDKIHGFDNPMVRVEVRAELDYDSMFELSEQLDKVIMKYDKNAFFDMDEPGIMSAYIEKVNL